MKAFQTVGISVDCMSSPGDSVKVIKKGQKVGGLSAEKGERLYFRIDVPNQVDALEIMTRGGWFAGDADLYVSFNELPTEGNFDCSSTSSNN